MSREECLDRAHSHALLAKKCGLGTSDTSEMCKWYQEMAEAYGNLASSGYDRDQVRRALNIMDGCVLKAQAMNIPFEHCKFYSLSESSKSIKIPTFR